MVGEAPGTNELRRGLPFVGMSGKITDDLVFKKAGLPTDFPIFVTNAMRCRPPKGPIKKEPLLACRQRLLDEITAYPRKLVLCLGASAFKSITGRYDLKITQERGKPLELPDMGIDYLFPTIHPAFVLRGSGNYKVLKSDILYAVSLLTGGSVKDAGDTSWVDVQTDVQLLEAIAEIKQAREIGLDIETDGPASGYSPRMDNVLIISIAYLKNKVFCFPPKYFYALEEILSDVNITQVWQNGKFDNPFLHKLGLSARLDEDVMLRHYALYPEMSGTHSLGAEAGNDLGARLYKKDVKDFMEPGKGFSSIPWPQLCERNAKDADYALQLLPIYRERMSKKRGLEELYQRTFLPAARFLIGVEDRGVWVNRETIGELKVELEAEIDAVMDRIDEMLAQPWNLDQKIWEPAEYVKWLKWQYDNGYRKQRPSGKKPKFFNPGSHEQGKYILYERLGLRPAKGFKMDYGEDSLVTMQGKHPIISLFLKFKELDKQISTYVNGFLKRIEPDDRVHSTFLIHGTVNGRLSSRKPSLQNVPGNPKIKQIVQAPKRRIFMELDYQGAELRTLAHLSGDKGLMKVFLEGRNLHDEVAIARYGKGYTRDQYLRAKAVNFGIAYGRENRSLALEFDVSEAEAQTWIDSWAELYPDAWAWLEKQAHLPLEGKTLVTPLGRRRSFGLVTRETMKATMNEARGFKPQSLASDNTLHSAIEMEPLIEPLDAYIVNLVHDSILIELPNNKRIAKEVYRIAKETMEAMPNKLLGTIVPFPVDVKVGKRWGKLSEWDGNGHIELKAAA